jgi:hypothetical protein
MRPVSLAALTAGADAVVIGRVRTFVSEWTADRALIVSVAEVEVAEVLKGRLLPAVVLVQIPGGRVGEIGLRVSDAPSFETGESVVLFLKVIPDPASPRNAYVVARNPRRSFTVHERAQGKFAVDRDGTVRRSGFDLPAGSIDPEPPRTLAGLTTAVRDLVRAARSAGRRMS